MGRISTFTCSESDQKLSILDYDDTQQSNAKYRAVINDEEIGVLHLQRVDTKDTPVSHLSLCPGVLESEVLETLSQSFTKIVARFFIEQVGSEIVYRYGE